MNKISLNVKPREVVGKKVKRLRKQAQVPVAMYGPKFAAGNFVANAKELKEVFAEAGYSNFVTVSVEGADQERTLVKEIQQHPVTDEILHASLYVIDKQTDITASVPVVIVGKAPIEDTGEGFVVPSLDSIAVRCLPDKLMSEIQVDVSKLANIGDAITVGDIQLPEGVALDSSMDATTAVVFVSGIQKVEEEAPVAEVELDADGNPIVPAEGEGEVAEGAETAKEE